MYTVKCDGDPLLDVRDDELILVNPRVTVEVNTVGSASFTIHKNHPYYGSLRKLKSVFEIADDVGVIFRGRMTEDTKDFYNAKAVDLEGLMAFFNDSTVPPFKFPEDFSEDAEYKTSAASGNVVEFFLNWLIENHNSQVQEFQKFKLGNVTVSDPNNYITRSETGILNTWEALKTKLFESALGGYLCIRYEDDGNYIDYLSAFELTNTQYVEFGENLLDMKRESDASMTYSAIIPFGAENEETGVKLSLESIPDGEISNGIYKVTLANGLHALYSQEAVDEYGWICAPVAETTWDDVTLPSNLLTKGETWLITQGMMMSDTVEFTASDLHFTDPEVKSYRIYRKINVNSTPHGIVEPFDLTKLDIPLLNPEQIKITVGKTRLTMLDQNSKDKFDYANRFESTKEELKDFVSGEIANIDGLYFYIRYSAHADGHDMTVSPQDDTAYMGTCSTSQDTAPTNHAEYTWCNITGKDGQDAILLMIESSAGNLFKNSNIATTLTVTIIVGDITITDSTKMKQVFGNSAKLVWRQMNMGESEFTDIPEDDERLSDNGFILTLNAHDISTKAIFNCTLDF